MLQSKEDLCLFRFLFLGPLSLLLHMVYVIRIYALIIRNAYDRP